jgi:CheY-like chemotaxis protein
MRYAVAAILTFLVLARMIFSPFAERVDNVSLILLGAVAILLLLPIERLTGLTVGSVAVVLDSPQVAGALTASLDRVADRALRRRLDELPADLALLPGARVLWIDDHPSEVVGERRILRALGVEVITATSSEQAIETLVRDSDFDLLVTDVQRKGGHSHERAGGIPLHEGVNLVVALRSGQVPELADVPSARAIRVLFYAAYDRARLAEFTRRARELDPESDSTNDLENLIVKAVRQLAEARRRPIEAPVRKTPT